MLRIMDVGISCNVSKPSKRVFFKKKKKVTSHIKSEVCLLMESACVVIAIMVLE